MTKKKTLFLIIAIFLVFSAVGCSFSNTADVKKIYGYKETDITETGVVREIAALLNTTEYEIAGVDTIAYSEPRRVTVNFKVDNRSRYRYIDETEFNQMAAVTFSLIENADEIVYMIFDDYGHMDDPNDAFYSAYYLKENFGSQISNDKITGQYIENSTETLKTYEEFYKAVMSIKIEKKDDKLKDEIYKFIGDDNEIVVNSGIAADVELDKLSPDNCEDIGKDLLGKIKKYQGKGITGKIQLYDIRNFKTGEVKRCVFLYYNPSDKKVVMIESDYVDRVRYNKILKIIMNEQTKGV